MIRTADSVGLRKCDIRGQATAQGLKREFIPPENILVYDVAKLYLQAEVYAGQPWPSAPCMENMMETAWC